MNELPKCSLFVSLPLESAVIEAVSRFPRPSLFRVATVAAVAGGVRLRLRVSGACWPPGQPRTLWKTTAMRHKQLRVSLA